MLSRREQSWDVERLESRALLSSISVSSLSDSGPGTLRAAIEQANLDPRRTRSSLPLRSREPSPFRQPCRTCQPTSPLPGPGLPRAGGEPEQRVRMAIRIMTIAAGVTVSISGLAITGGHFDDTPGAIPVSAGGSATPVRSGSRTASSPAMPRAGTAGAFANTGTLTVSGSTISRNSARLEGGGIFNYGMLRVHDSVIGDNTCDIRRRNLHHRFQHLDPRTFNNTK